MKNIKTILIALFAIGVLGSTYLQAQTSDKTTMTNTATTADKVTTETPEGQENPPTGKLTWIVALAVVGAVLIGAVVYRNKKAKTEGNDPRTDESINNPASGI